MKREASRDRVFLLALVAGVFVFFAPSLTGRGVLFFGDVTNYALRLAYTGRWLRAGRFALWNPLLSLGAPHAVDTGTQAFYPVHPLLSLLLRSRLYDSEAALHVLLAAVGMFALARTLQTSRPAALLAGIAYGFSGFAFGHLQHLNVLVAIAWIPVVLAATERYLTTASYHAMGLAALALGLLVLGGHPQLVLYGLVAEAAFCVFRLTTLAREGQGSRLPRLTLGLLAVAVLGVSLAAVFLLPFAEWMRFISRTEHVTAEFATSYSLPPNRLVGLIHPFWFGGPLGRAKDGASLVEWSWYVGLLPVGLALVALARPSGRVLFFLGLGLAALLLGLGDGTPLYRLLRALPVFGSVRAPARFLVVADLSLALLAAFGLDGLRAGAGRRTARVAAIVFLYFGWILARAAWIRERSVILFPFHGRHPWALLRADAIRFDQPDTIIVLLTLFGTSAILWALATREGGRRSLLFLALLFAGVDLFAFRAQLFFYAPAPPGAFEEPSGTAESIRRAGDTPRFYTQTGKELEGLVFDGGNFAAYRRQMWESLRTSLPMRFDLQSLTGYLTEPPMHAKLIEFIRGRGAFDSRAAQVAGVFGVRYVVASPIRQVSAPQLTVVARGVRNLFRNELAMPRAYLVPRSRAAANEIAAFAFVRRPTFDPHDEVVVEVDTPPPAGGSLAFAQATIVGDEPDRVVVRTVTTRAAWLVLNDTFAPGWTASIDGTATTILRANALVRAVAVSAGVHQVEFVYAPTSVRWGAGLSAAALIVVCGLVLFGERRVVSPQGL